MLKKVVVSGYFDPLHIGHLEYIKLAKKFGHILIVIVNNDFQCELKKGKSFMNEQDRCKIMESIKGVDVVILSIDKDRSVCKTLEMIQPDVFANGGDQDRETSPEAKLCEKVGIEFIDGLGEKIRNSSDFTGLTQK